MPKDAIISDLEKTLGLQAGVLKEALESDDSDFTMPSVKVFTEEDLQKRDENLLKDSNKGLEDKLKDAETKGKELLLKDMKNSLGLEYEGRKDPEKFIEAFRSKVQSEAEIEPNKLLDDAKSDISKLKDRIELLTSEKQEIQTSLDNTISGYQKEKENALIKGSIKQLLPGEDKLTIGHDHLMVLMEAKYEMSLSEGSIQFKDRMSGEVMKNDHNRDPLTADEFVSKFTDEFAKKPSGGTGAGSSGSGGKVTLSEFTKAMVEKGVPQNSPEFVAELNSKIKSGTIDITA